MGNQKSSIKFNPEVTHHKGGTQSTNNLISLLQKGNYFSCKIILDNINYGTGFFAKILSPFDNNKIIKVLFTCYHVLRKQFLNSHNVINLEFNNEERKIFLKSKNRLIWLNENLDYTCIEILDEDNIKEFLKIDFEIYEENYNENLKKEEIILFGYNKDENDENSKYSSEFGIILQYDTKNKVFYANYNSTPGSSGGAILLKRGYKLIGMHKGGGEETKTKEKLNFVIPINIILRDLKNKNSFYKLELEDNKKENLNTIKVKEEEIIEKNNKSNKESNKNIIEKKTEKKIKKNEIKEDNNMLNVVSEHLGELNDLIKEKYFSIICKECGEKYIKEIELGKFEFAKMMVDKKIFENCKKCGKNNYGFDIPYNLNLKCKNCGNNCFEEGLPFSMLEVVLLLEGNFKNCEICGKNDFILISDKKNV